ncbi:hypothetical protein [Leisingera sp. ANG-Vp]|uniref:hypothetical protein n=1 Tax=Leisingera sp. ANG-Vp TaxID=1577896 RepID=UPI00126A52D4|nr:hypothetical protein [Leisingera sp. ANG-Vp]
MKDKTRAHSKNTLQALVFVGTQGRTRTGTLSPAGDFEFCRIYFFSKAYGNSLPQTKQKQRVNVGVAQRFGSRSNHYSGRTAEALQSGPGPRSFAIVTSSEVLT